MRKYRRAMAKAAFERHKIAHMNRKTKAADRRNGKGKMITGKSVSFFALNWRNI